MDTLDPWTDLWVKCFVLKTPTFARIVSDFSVLWQFGLGGSSQTSSALRAQRGTEMHGWVITAAFV